MTTDEKLVDAIKWIDELRVERDGLKRRISQLESTLLNIKQDMGLTPVFPEEILAEIAECGL
jgi:hypothetical protein